MENPQKILGSQMTFSGKRFKIYSHVGNHIHTGLEKIDSLQLASTKIIFYLNADLF